MKQVRTLIAVAIGALGTSAFAADMAVKAPRPALAPIANWSGCYIGANGGAAFGMNSTMTWTDIHPPPSSGAVQFDQINFNRSSTVAGIVGGQLGCNWQVSPIYILGLESDASWIDVSNTASQNGLTQFGVLVPGNAGVTMSEKTDFLGSVRGRAGLLWGGTFVYGTGGVAWAHEKFSGSEFFADGRTSATTFSRTPTGWVAGLGAETMIQPNWLLRFEFLYYGFNGTSSTVPVVPFTPNHPANVYSWGSSNIGVARIGLSYKFY
jgi:outer membrane immunogenic protein